MANFSAAELTLIQDQQKLEKNLPSYYSVEAGRQVTISRDFENYLILQTADQKEKTLSWIRTASEFVEINVERDELVSRYLVLRSQDAQSRIDELDEVLNKFNDFRVGLLGTEEDALRFAQVVEVSTMAQSLQRPLDEVSILREKAFHEQTISGILKLRLDNRENTSDTQKELQSWQQVLVAYKGQANSSAPDPGSGIGGLAGNI